MDKYEIIDTIGEGYDIVRTYGTVYKARHKQTGVKFAIKKFKESEDDEHVKKTAIREIRMLKLLKHPNIVTLYEVFRQNKKLYLVFEYVDRTLLEDIENNSNGLDTQQVKKVMYQLLKAISYCHNANVALIQVIHRDIKPENILITRNGILKLCDFGFARTLTSKSGRYTDYVSTRWYRAPELLVGDTQYGKEVDVWAIGCLFAELFTGVPLFPGDSDIDTLHHIMRLCGANLPDKHVQAFYNNPLYEGIEIPKPNAIHRIENRFRNLPITAREFLRSCLVYEPGQRPTCDELLKHDYFEPEFRQNFEQELLDLIALEMQENKLTQRYPLSESNSPEPHNMPKIMNRDSTPVKFNQKNIGTVHLNPYELLPKGSSLKHNSETPDLEARPFGAFSPANGPPANFLPDLKIKRDEDASLSYLGIRKRKSDLKISRVIQKGSTELSSLSKPLPSVKIVDLTDKISHYTAHDQYDSYGLKVKLTQGHTSLKNRNTSRSNLKSRNSGEFSYLSVIATPVPPAVHNNRNPFPKKVNAGFYKPKQGLVSSINFKNSKV